MCREFKEIVYDPRDDIDVLEIGCGVGNSMVPLLRVNPSIKFYACDISKNAVLSGLFIFLSITHVVVQEDEYLQPYVTAFVHDITKPIPIETMPDNSVDYILLVFVLSTISPELFEQTLINLKRVLRPGGIFFFRDYAMGDMKEDIFEERGNKLSDRFYLRQDGTRIYFFTTEEISNLGKKLGFECIEEKVIEVTNINHKKQLTMSRKYVQAKWKNPCY